MASQMRQSQLQQQPATNPLRASTTSLMSGHGGGGHGVLKAGAPKSSAMPAYMQASSFIQAERIGLRKGAFVQMRREVGKGLREELDRASDERLDRYRCKMMALSVESLTRPGYQDPRHAMREVRHRAALLAEQEEMAREQMARK